MPNAPQESSFLSPEPPHWVARALARGLLTLFVVTTVLAFVVQIPETVSGRFVLMPQRGTDPVRALREGVVTRAYVQEGDTVSAESPLFDLQSAPIGDRAASLRSLQAGLAADSARLTIALSQLETRRRADDGEARRLASRIDYLDRLIESKQRRYRLARELADSAQAGYRRGSVGRYEASRMEFDAATIQEEIQTNLDDRDDTRASLERMKEDARARELEYQETRRGLLEALETAKIRIAALQHDLGSASGDFGMTVRAPCRGAVLRLMASRAGTVVKEGEVLAEVGCAGEKLQAELSLPEGGIATVRPGQDVKLRYDAFPYQRYGVRYGEVRWLGPSGVGSRDSGAFRALIDPRDSVIKVRGQARPLMPGMGGRADIVVGRRSLVSYALEPIRALKENFAEPPPQ